MSGQTIESCRIRKEYDAQDIHAKAEANLIAKMQVARSYYCVCWVEKETRVDGEEIKKEVMLALVAAHYRRNLKGDETLTQDRINAANSVYMLLTSVGYHVTNATQSQWLLFQSCR